MEHSEALNELATALAKAQAKLPTVGKDKRAQVPTKAGGSYSYTYADLASTWDACRAILSTEGLSIVWLPFDGVADTIGLRTMLLHSSGQWLSESTIPLARRDAQGVGSGLTYLRRYRSSALVGLVADDDDDGAAAVGRPQPMRKAQPAAAGGLREKLLDLMGTVESGGHDLTAAEIKLLDAIDSLPVDRLENGIRHFEKLLKDLPPAAS